VFCVTEPGGSGLRWDPWLPRVVDSAEVSGLRSHFGEKWCHCKVVDPQGTVAILAQGTDRAEAMPLAFLLGMMA
jgi:hypothetical protein